MTLAYVEAPRFAFSWFSGTPQAPADVPAGFMVALDGHPYNVYMSQEGLFDHQTVPHQRPYNYSSAELGERSLNPDAAWRVTDASWVKGAGQRYLDATDSDPGRFWQSKGIDCWTPAQFSLLPATTQIKSSADTHLQLVSCGQYLYVGDGLEVYFSSDGSVWTASNIKGADAGSTTVLSLATDGNRVWAACGTNGVHVTTRAATSSSHENDLHATLVAWVKGRLMGALGPSLYIVPTGSTTPPSPLFTHDNSDWTWTAICAGDNAVYAIGYSGDYSAVYRFVVLSDGSGLGPGILAAELPRGEIGLALGAYEGFVLIGSSLGIRTCAASTTGDLQVGALVPTHGTRCIVGYDRFVWFGWDNFDSSSAGLGRLDLSVFNGVAPAYASDLMGATGGLVVAVANFAGRRAFSIAGQGVYWQSTSPVSTGFLDSGRINYEVSDPKNILGVQTRQESPLNGAHNLALSVDDGGFVSLGAVSLNGSVEALEKRGEVIELRHTLTPSGSNSPVVRRATALALVCPTSAVKIKVPLELNYQLGKDNGQGVLMRVNDEREFLEGLRRSRELFIYQEGDRSFRATMVDFDFIPYEFLPDRSGFGGIFVAELLTVAV